MPQEFLNAIAIAEKHVFLVYFMLFLAAIAQDKRVSSLVIGLFVLCASQALSVGAAPDLYLIATPSGIAYKFVWYGFWLLTNLMFVWLIYQLHLIHEARVSMTTTAISLQIVLNSVLQLLDFSDRATADIQLFAVAYQILIPTLTVGIVPLILVLWGYEYRNKRSIAAAEA
ncbi:MAG: hypothetical protein KKF79_07770 [Gammaproteobacteria bacterium]|jgi:hypothetical protein|nr:hypothetical protein [Gammaproteobacteria bacterium]MBU2278956.1 hypothetical protein [Gammaproteobacteria bacterium]MBU2426769.1 hypothetical protein [Gammaproteobacteria bacterium]